MRDQPHKASAATSIHSDAAATSERPVRAKKSLGQNFLVDGHVRAKIVDAADISPDDTIVEIGPGRGFLTKALAERAGRVVAVELDDGLVPQLRETFADSGHVEVVHDDARTIDINSLVGAAREYKVVANLPYYAATPIIRRFLEDVHRPTTLVVMVQREVGQEMTASPGKMGILSVATQVYGRPRIVTTVPSRAFRPSPNVTSAVLRIDTYSEPAVAFEEADKFFTLVRAGFSARRKQLHNSLRNGLDMDPDAVLRMLDSADISPTRRAQTLSIEEWSRLYRKYVSTL